MIDIGYVLFPVAAILGIGLVAFLGWALHAHVSDSNESAMKKLRSKLEKDIKTLAEEVSIAKADARTALIEIKALEKSKHEIKIVPVDYYANLKATHEGEASELPELPPEQQIAQDDKALEKIVGRMFNPIEEDLEQDVQ